MRQNSFGLLLMGVVFSLFFIAGCASVTQETAETAALSFAREHVRFYEGDQSNVLGTSAVSMSIAKVEKNPVGDYVITLVIANEATEEVKTTDVLLIVDKKTGKVIEFNGQPVLPNLN